MGARPWIALTSTRLSFTGSRTRPEGLVVEVDMVAGDQRLGRAPKGGGGHCSALGSVPRHGRPQVALQPLFALQHARATSLYRSEPLRHACKHSPGHPHLRAPSTGSFSGLAGH